MVPSVRMDGAPVVLAARDRLLPGRLEISPRPVATCGGDYLQADSLANDGCPDTTYFARFVQN
ncbi:hypothetical protein FF36_05509 [Frankia torreyi]|uniref:Uncharacterized protein n=1 Tax=Frankia torreyi TaxID=1856 RepID=A0A0D8B7A6_9ACTN|nr:hypothetical protein FF36_05509 [Frankia torreyi]KQM02472.1 hypothetical protein FF86_106621 [Frankia sp. CpI1-P]